MDFLVNLSPAFIVIHIVTMLIFHFLYRNKLDVSEEIKQKVTQINPLDEIKDYALLRKSLLVLGLTILGFILHQMLHLESATIALSGAALLMLISKEEPEDIFLAIEWPSIFFFAGLFIVVGGLVETGLINRLAQWALDVTAGKLAFPLMLLSIVISTGYLLLFFLLTCTLSTICGIIKISMKIE